VTGAWVILVHASPKEDDSWLCEGEEDLAQTILLVVLGTIRRLQQNTEEILSMLRTVSRAFRLCR
jgi:hypothetical protein